MEEKTNRLPLFVTSSPSAKRRLLFKLYALSTIVAISFVLYYRVRHYLVREHNATEAEKWAWIGSFLSELWFAFYWSLNLVVRWNPVIRHNFKDRLSLRYEKVLPGIDIFVCTADPVIEPPIMVINTVLSVMAYDYPPERMSIYLSDDGASDLTFYALLEASRFAEKWLPFCRKFSVEPRCPEAYFTSCSVHRDDDDPLKLEEWTSMKNLYEDLRKRIELTSKAGRTPEEIHNQHKGFFEWHSFSSKRDHQTILQIIIDGRDPMAMDAQGLRLPTLVYLAREKRPQCHHHFKAGSLNALIRVSSRISNAPIILNIDCDMYSNSSESVRDALCFFMDGESGRKIGYVQCPQSFDNLSHNDLYGSCYRVIREVELAGYDSNGGPPFLGTGCFHLREALCGRKYEPGCESESLMWDQCKRVEGIALLLEETGKELASCRYDEENTEWGNEKGIMYGCPAEDNLTGLAVQYRGWSSIYFNPDRARFLGVGTTTLLQTLVQNKRWSEGLLQIFLSRYCPLVGGYGKIPLKLQLSHCIWHLWAANCLATLYYVTVPSLCLLHNIALFPKVSSLWGLPFIYSVVATSIYSAREFLQCGGTFQGWLNDQRMLLYKRTTSYFFGSLDNILRVTGFTKSAFVITAKVADDDVTKRYEQEIMEFGVDSPMFTILATIALINLFCFAGGIIKVVMHGRTLEQLAMQIILCGLLVYINLPLYEGLLLRRDNGRMPASVTYKSAVFALCACSIAVAWA